MKTKSKVLLGVAVGLLVVLGASFFASGSSLQGRFIGGGAISLSSSSPSGSRSVSVADDIFAFNVTATAVRPSVIQDQDVLFFKFSSSAGDIDPANGEGGRMSLTDSSGNEVGHGYVITYEAAGNPFYAYGAVVMLDTVTVAAAGTETLTLTLDSTSLIDEDSGVDDTLVVSMRYGTATVTGNTVNY